MQRHPRVSSTIPFKQAKDGDNTPHTHQLGILFTPLYDLHHLPPGPPTLPVLGNILSFPTKQMYLKFSEWSEQYGEIVSLKLGGGTVVVLNTVEAVRDVLERQALATSNRPPSVAAEAVTDGLHFATINPSEYLSPICDDHQKVDRSPCAWQLPSGGRSGGLRRR